MTRLQTQTEAQKIFRQINAVLTQIQSGTSRPRTVVARTGGSDHYTITVQLDKPVVASRDRPHSASRPSDRQTKA